MSNAKVRRNSSAQATRRRRRATPPGDPLVTPNAVGYVTSVEPGESVAGAGVLE